MTLTWTWHWRSRYCSRAGPGRSSALAGCVPAPLLSEGSLTCQCQGTVQAGGTQPLLLCCLLCLAEQCWLPECGPRLLCRGSGVLGGRVVVPRGVWPVPGRWQAHGIGVVCGPVLTVCVVSRGQRLGSCRTDRPLVP